MRGGEGREGGTFCVLNHMAIFSIKNVYPKK